MNIYCGEARAGVSRAGLGRGCTLMQWFIFGLRASWTSSIIVIHRRKWAARGGAGAAGSPRATLSRSPTLSPLARERRDSRRLRLTHSVNRGPCVSALRDLIRCRCWIEPLAVQSSASASVRAVFRQEPAAIVVPVSIRRSRQLSWPPRLHSASARWVRSITACTRSTPLCVYFESLANLGPRWIACSHFADHHKLSQLPWVDISLRNCDHFSSVKRAAASVDKQCRLLQRWATNRLACLYADYFLHVMTSWEWRTTFVYWCMFYCNNSEGLSGLEFLNMKTVKDASFRLVVELVQFVFAHVTTIVSRRQLTSRRVALFAKYMLSLTRPVTPHSPTSDIIV